MPGKFINVDAPYTRIPVVLPEAADPAISGRLRNVPCAPHVNNGLIVKTENGWDLAPGLARKGYALLEDLYAEENNPDGWAKYQEYLRDMAAGRTRSSFPRDLLPKEVLRRQGIETASSRDKWARPAPSPTTAPAASPRAKSRPQQPEPAEA